VEEITIPSKEERALGYSKAANNDKTKARPKRNMAHRAEARRGRGEATTTKAKS
jgi:hypothetical protein